MSLNRPPKRLSNEDLLELETFIDSRSPMALYEFWGFLAAIVSHPVMIPPSGWMGHVLDDDFPMESPEEANRILMLIMGYWNQTVRDFESGVATLPIDEPDGLLEWCSGYLAGMYLDESWIDEDLEGEPSPFVAIEFYVSARSREGKLSPKEKDILDEIDGEFLADTALSAYRHFKEARLREAEETVTWRKAGRNDPCPCGSGKKYKRCCWGEHRQ